MSTRAWYEWKYLDKTYNSRLYSLPDPRVGRLQFNAGENSNERLSTKRTRHRPLNLWVVQFKVS
ncbi:hypothetical protein PROFUN_08646 [Planoprotostelium fungivorum]|uniref:Uncharacterized protein n=1 Tax=Planoprotostelium fungivorum TaxID=1890364 RepID=A0A2P6NJ44_9EUKA|nr:hypothetical protein PROFUN_08646 [Planoprotostelium fungivorum]